MELGPQSQITRIVFWPGPSGLYGFARDYSFSAGGFTGFYEGLGGFAGFAMGFPGVHVALDSHVQVILGSGYILRKYADSRRPCSTP